MAYCHQTITVMDRESPTIDCPNDFQTTTEQGEWFLQATLDFNDAAAEDNSLALSMNVTYLSQDPIQQAIVPDGTEVADGAALRLGLSRTGTARGHVFLWQVTDPSGNSASCEQSILVTDDEAPVAECPLEVTVVTDPGQHYATTYVPDYPNLPRPHHDIAINEVLHLNLDDNSAGAGGELRVVANAVFAGTVQAQMATLPGLVRLPLAANTGTTINGMRYVVTDATNNALRLPLDVIGCFDTAGYVRVITEDREPPTIVCPDDRTVFTDNGDPRRSITLDAPNLADIGSEPARVAGQVFAGYVTDNSHTGGSTTGVKVFVSELVGQGTVVNRNTASEDFRPTYRELSANSLPSNVDFYLNVNDVGVYDGTTAVHVVNYTATDPSGNMAYCHQTITVMDRESPTIACPADRTIETDVSPATQYAALAQSTVGEWFATATFSLSDAIISDNSAWTGNNYEARLLATNITYLSQDPIQQAVVPGGTKVADGATLQLGLSRTGTAQGHVFFWQVTDPSGNSASCEQTIAIIDTILPTVRCPLEVTVVTDPGQHYATTYVPQSVGLGRSPPSRENPLNELGSTWIDDNSIGAGGELVLLAVPEFVVQGVQGQLPVLPAEVRFPLHGATGGSVDNAIEYTVTDPSLLTASCQNTVRTVDLELPTLTCPADIVVRTDRRDDLDSRISGNHFSTLSLLHIPSEMSRIGDAPDDPDRGISSDNSMTGGGLLTPRMYVSELVRPVASQSQPTQYGYPEVKARYQPASSSSYQGVLSLHRTKTWEQPGFTGNPFSNSVSPETGPGFGYREITEGQFNFPLQLDGVSGSHVVKYSVEDPSGNMAFCEQTITVEDPEGPRIECPADLILETLTDEDHALVYIHRTHPDRNTDPCITGDTRAVRLGLCVDDDNSLSLDETGGSLLDRDGRATFTRHKMLYHGSRTMARAHVDEYVEISDGEPIRLWLHSNGTSRMHYITHQLTDASNNTETCTQMITVVDPEEPMFTCPPDVTVSTVPGQHHTTITVHNPDDAWDNSVKVRNGKNGEMRHYREEQHGNEMHPILPHLRRGGHPFQDGASNQPAVDHGLLSYYNPASHLVDLHNGTYDRDQRPWRMLIETPAHLTYSISYGGNTDSSDDPIRGTYGDELHSGSLYDFGLNPSRGDGHRHYVEYTVTDVSGNNRSCTQSITVVDIEPPVIHCPNVTFVQFADVDQWGSSVSVVRYYNSHTNASNCSKAPGVCENRLVFATDTGASFATVVVPDAVMFDNSENQDSFGNYGGLTYNILYRGNDVQGQSVVFSLNGPLTPDPSDRLEFRVTDPSGNTASCFRDVLVVDLERPRISCPADAHVTLYDGEESTTQLTWDDPLVQDNLDGTAAQASPFYQSRYVGTLGPIGSDDSDCAELPEPFWSFPPERCICSDPDRDAVYFAPARMFLGHTLSDPIVDNLAPSFGAGNGLAAPITCARAYQLANVGAYPDDLCMADVLQQLQRFCCSQNKAPIFRAYPQRTAPRPLPECVICGEENRSSQILTSLTMRWQSGPGTDDGLMVSIRVDGADVVPAAGMRSGDVFKVVPYVESFLFPHRASAFPAYSVFAVNDDYASAVALDTSCTAPLTLGYEVQFDGIGSLRVVGFETLEGDARELRTEGMCAINRGNNPTAGGDGDGGWGGARWTPQIENYDQADGYPLDECDAGLMQSIQSEGCNAGSSTVAKCRCLQVVATQGNTSLSCTPAGSYVSLSEFAGQYCHRHERGARSTTGVHAGLPAQHEPGFHGDSNSFYRNYPFDGSYLYSATWYARGQRRVVRRPVSGGSVRVRVPATRSNNEFVITYTATDASGNSASCNFTASLQVNCKATPLPDEEVQSLPVGMLGGWPSTEASDSVIVPCGATHQGTKRRTCDARGTWAQHPDLSACSDSRSDTVATFTFAIATNYSHPEAGPELSITVDDADRDSVRGISFAAPHGGRWHVDECAAFESSQDRERVLLTDPGRKQILISALASLGLVVHPDNAKVFKICNQDPHGEYASLDEAMFTTFEVLVYGSDCSTETLHRNMAMLRNAVVGFQDTSARARVGASAKLAAGGGGVGSLFSGAVANAAAAVPVDTQTLDERRRYALEALHELEPHGTRSHLVLVNGTNLFDHEEGEPRVAGFPTTVLERTFCPNMKWLGRPMRLSDNGVPIFTLDSNIAGCPRIGATTVVDTNHDSTSTTHHDDDLHDDDDNLGLCANNNRPGSLTFRLVGGGAADTTNAQSGGVVVTGDTLSAGSFSSASCGSVVNGDLLVVSAFYGDFTYCDISGPGGSQSIAIDTSCSSPISVGDQFGAVVLIYFAGSDAKNTGRSGHGYGHTDHIGHEHGHIDNAHTGHVHAESHGGHVHRQHHHHHDFCHGVDGYYRHCDHVDLVAACDGYAAVPGRPEMRRACQDICDAVDGCTGFTVQHPDVEAGICILFDKNASPDVFGDPDHLDIHNNGEEDAHFTAHDPNGLELAHEIFSYSGSASNVTIAALQKCVDLQHEFHGDVDAGSVGIDENSGAKTSKNGGHDEGRQEHQHRISDYERLNAVGKLSWESSRTVFYCILHRSPRLPRYSLTLNSPHPTAYHARVLPHCPPLRTRPRCWSV